MNDVTIVAGLGHARTALVQARTDLERLLVRDHARALQEAAGIIKRRDIQTEASILVQDAERAIAKANPPAPPGRGKTVTRDNGITPEVTRQIRSAHAKLTDDEYDERVQAARDSQEPLTRKALRNPAANLSLLYTGAIEWYTPAEYIDAARAVMGGIDLDPASSAVANETVKAARYFTAEDDGLAQEWAGRVWLNPPYKMPLIRDFVLKLFDSQGVTEAVLLTNNATDTKWWHHAAVRSAANCFTAGRINFYNQAGGSNGPTNGQCFFYAGPNALAFHREFGRFGWMPLMA